MIQFRTGVAAADAAQATAAAKVLTEDDERGDGASPEIQRQPSSGATFRLFLAHDALPGRCKQT